jgi:hypothetical protein
LGDAAPPVFWRRGDVPRSEPAAICGSEGASELALDWAKSTASEVAHANMTLVTGSQSLCDRAAEASALSAGGSVIRFLPRGFDSTPAERSVCDLSLLDWPEAQSAVTAKEANLFAYFSTARSLALCAKIGAGASWYGASEALKRRLDSVFVPEPLHENACRALLYLGATALMRPADFTSSQPEKGERTRFPPGVAAPSPWRK